MSQDELRFNASWWSGALGHQRYPPVLFRTSNGGLSFTPKWWRCRCDNMASSAVPSEAPIIEPSGLCRNCVPIWGVDPQPVGRINPRNVEFDEHNLGELCIFEVTEIVINPRPCSCVSNWGRPINTALDAASILHFSYIPLTAASIYKLQTKSQRTHYSLPTQFSQIMTIFDGQYSHLDLAYRTRSAPCTTNRVGRAHCRLRITSDSS